MNESWFLLAVAILYEMFLFIGVVFLTMVGIFEAPYFGADPAIVKWLFLAAAVLDFIFFLRVSWATTRQARRPRSAQAWHFALGTWVWVWPLIGAFWWHETFAALGASPPEFDLANSDKTKGYIRWMMTLVIAAIAAIATLVSAIIMVRNKFAMEKVERKLRAKK